MTSPDALSLNVREEVLHCIGLLSDFTPGRQVRGVDVMQKIYEKNGISRTSAGFRGNGQPVLPKRIKQTFRNMREGHCGNKPALCVLHPPGMWSLTEEGVKMALSIHNPETSLVNPSPRESGPEAAPETTHGDILSGLPEAGRKILCRFREGVVHPREEISSGVPKATWYKYIKLFLESGTVVREDLPDGRVAYRLGTPATCEVSPEEPQPDSPPDDDPDDVIRRRSIKAIQDEVEKYVRRGQELSRRLYEERMEAARVSYEDDLARIISDADAMMERATVVLDRTLCARRRRINGAKATQSNVTQAWMEKNWSSIYSMMCAMVRKRLPKSSQYSLVEDHVMNYVDKIIRKDWMRKFVVEGKTINPKSVAYFAVHQGISDIRKLGSDPSARALLGARTETEVARTPDPVTANTLTYDSKVVYNADEGCHSDFVDTSSFSSVEDAEAFYEAIEIIEALVVSDVSPEMAEKNLKVLHGVLSGEKISDMANEFGWNRSTTSNIKSRICAVVKEARKDGLFEGILP